MVNELLVPWITIELITDFPKQMPGVRTCLEFASIVHFASIYESYVNLELSPA